MFGLGMTELLVILAIVLLIFGPKRLKNMMKTTILVLGEGNSSQHYLEQSTQCTVLQFFRSGFPPPHFLLLPSLNSC